MRNKKNKIKKRVAANLILLALLFIAPWWIVMSVAVLFLFYFKNYFEILIFGFLLDLLYGAPVSAYYGMGYVISVIAALAFALVAVVKNRLVFFEFTIFSYFSFKFFRMVSFLP